MGIADDLERLQALRERGALSEAEYQRAKARVLDEAERPAGTGGAASLHGAPAPPDDGSDAGFGGPQAPSFLDQLARSRADRWLGGVCGGLGAHTRVPSWAWRLIFCAVSLYFGFGILFYILLWVFLPLEP